LEFVWVGDDAIDPLQQAQTLQILVSVGIKTRAEARAEQGLGGGEKGGLNQVLPAGRIGKWNFDPNQPRDEDGRWTAEGNAADPVGHPARKPRPQGARTTQPSSAPHSHARLLVRGQVRRIHLHRAPLDHPRISTRSRVC